MKRIIFQLVIVLTSACCLHADDIYPRRLFDAEKRQGDTRPRPDLTPTSPRPSPNALGEGNRVKAPGWQPNGICICDTSGAALPKIVTDGNHGAIICWTEYYRGWPADTTHVYNDIYAQRVDSGGNELWPHQGVPVCSLAATASDYPTIVADGYGGAIIAWEEAGRIPDGHTHVFAQRLDSMGNRLWPENGILVCSQMSGYVDICSDGHGGAIIAYVDGRDEATTSDNIYAQRIDSAGNPVWPIDGVPVCTADSIQFWPQICSNNDGGAVITWQDDYRNNGTTGEDVYAQMLDSLGNAKWAVNGEPICVKPNMQRAKNPIPNHCGGGIIGWWAFGDTVNVAYIQSIDSVGNRKWVEDVPLNTLVRFNIDNRGGR